MQWGILLPPLTLSDFDEIFTVASLHHVLPPSKISWQLDNIKMPKLDFKVESRQLKILKNQLLQEDNAKLCKGGGNHDPQFFVGVIFKKNFSPYLAFLAFQKKIKNDRCHV